MNTKKRISVGALALLLLILSVVMVWGNSSSLGQVSMQRTIINYANENKTYTGSGIMMMPKNATSEDVRAFTQAVTNYMLGLNYVDSDKLMVTGFSAGQSWATMTAVWNPGVFRTAMILSSYNTKYSGLAKENGFNFIAIKADKNASGLVYDECGGRVLTLAAA